MSTIYRPFPRPAKSDNSAQITKIDADQIMSDEITAPALAAATATLPDALALDTLAVIGLMNTANGMAALLRSSRGEIVRVSIGQQAFGREVTAIGDDQILLTNWWGQTEALQLPHS